MDETFDVSSSVFLLGGCCCCCCCLRPICCLRVLAPPFPSHAAETQPLAPTLRAAHEGALSRFAPLPAATLAAAAATDEARLGAPTSVRVSVPADAVVVDAAKQHCVSVGWLLLNRVGTPARRNNGPTPQRGRRARLESGLPRGRPRCHQEPGSRPRFRSGVCFAPVRLTPPPIQARRRSRTSRSPSPPT